MRKCDYCGFTIDPNETFVFLRFHNGCLKEKYDADLRELEKIIGVELETLRKFPQIYTDIRDDIRSRLKIAKGLQKPAGVRR